MPTQLTTVLETKRMIGFVFQQAKAEVERLVALDQKEPAAVPVDPEGMLDDAGVLAKLAAMADKVAACESKLFGNLDLEALQAK